MTEAVVAEDVSGEFASFSHSDRSVFAAEDRLSGPIAAISCLFKRNPNMRKLRVVLLALALTAACLFEGAQSFSSSRVDVRGPITHISRAEGQGRGGVLARILIEGAKEPDTEVDKASVTVTAETGLFIRMGGERKPAGLAALEEGQKVEASFTGPVMESYPVQATAAEITILEK